MIEQFQSLLEQLIATGKADPALLQLINEARSDPTKMDQLFEQLKELAGGLEEPLNIEDYYTEADGSKFDLRWELGPGNPLIAAGISFEMLDRKTQFFTLFAEWQRRETEGMMELTNGDLGGAEQTFNECVARADQIDVDELRARSYENLVRVAEKRGDQGASAKWLGQAQAARAQT